MLKKLFLVLVLVVIGLGLTLVLDYKPTISLNEISLKKIEYAEENEADNYKITADYPHFSGITTGASGKINSDLKNSFLDAVDKFQTGAKEFCNFEDLEPAPEWACELAVAVDSFSVVDNKILSVLTEYYQYMGGAHGGTVFTFTNYDLNSGERLDWREVFSKEKDYLKFISDYAFESLKEKMLTEEPYTDEDWLREGTSPTEENYNTNVGFYENGLKIIFQQYQVAPYAAGTQEVMIPFSELKDFLAPNGLLSEFSVQS